MSPKPCPTCDATTLKPPTDIRESSKAFTVEMELPGLSLEEILVEVRENTLLIRGHRHALAEIRSGEAVHRLERPYGPFERILTLPDTVDPEGIHATLSNGLLTVSLPRTQLSQKIQVR